MNCDKTSGQMEKNLDMGLLMSGLLSEISTRTELPRPRTCGTLEAL